MTMGASASAIDEVYRTHGHHVRRRAMRLLGNESDAREVLQEVFVSLLSNPSQYAGRGALTTWLYSATTNACLNRLRDARTRRQILERAGAPEPLRVATAPDDALELRRLLARLPADLARVAVHHHLDEMTHEEIASMMGCSRRHVGDLLARLATAAGGVS